jgi:hypothetical protein
LVIVSVFSANVGVASTGDGEGEVAETGAADAEALGEVVAAAGELPGVADGDGAATIGTGGGKCVAV